MKILVCGNINSGKSYLIDKLVKLLPGYKVAKIDEYRKMFGVGTIETEIVARQKFVDYVVSTQCVIAELSGMGDLGLSLYSQLEGHSFILILVDTSVGICLQRLQNKAFNDIPYPPVEEKMSDTIVRIDKEIQDGQIHSLWQDKSLQIFRVSKEVELESIPFSLMDNTIKVLNILKPNPNIKEIVSYGSLGRNEISKYSDIDLFVTTKLCINDIVILFLKLPLVTLVDTVGNKITIRFNSQLIEVVIVSRIEDNSWYYVNSMITNAKPTIIKGDNNTLNQLQNCINTFSFDKKAIVSETVKRMMFFVLSLDTIANKGDDYKFFFHNNIVIHELVRLHNFANDKYEYNYLPQNIWEAMPKEIHDLVYDMVNDKKIHIAKVKKAAKITLGLLNYDYSKYFELLV